MRTQPDRLIRYPTPSSVGGHTSVRSQYAKVSAEALGRWHAETDPAARRDNR
ncbi:hypothetical protein AB0L63_29650 [Nocardia sp. NPDC051990]|uniref:hypothetical protein n=1 Tax=Nocardia sp. NPDC051990 TaxID=3155285 RepID=UPI00342890E2